MNKGRVEFISDLLFDPSINSDSKIKNIAEILDDFAKYYNDLKLIFYVTTTSS